MPTASEAANKPPTPVSTQTQIDVITCLMGVGGRVLIRDEPCHVRHRASFLAMAHREQISPGEIETAADRMSRTALGGRLHGACRVTRHYPRHPLPDRHRR